MASAWRSRLTTVVGAAGLVVVGIASPAWADPITININPGNIADGGTSAATFANKSCDPNFGGGPYVGQDVWVFNLPSEGPAAEKSTFVSVTATFDTGSGTATRSIPPDGQIVFNGTSKAYTTTPAGWKLTGATAQVTKAEEFFVLTHTCPAGAATTAPVPTTAKATTAAPTTGTTQTSGSTTSAPATSSPVVTTGVAPTSAAATTGAVPVTTAPATPSDSGGLPVTGGALGGLIATGLGLVAAGAALIFLRRRRNTGAEA